MTQEEKIEQAGKRLHLLLYADENPTPEFIEWRADLESAISDFIDIYKNAQHTPTEKEIDTSISPAPPHIAEES